MDTKTAPVTPLGRLSELSRLSPVDLMSVAAVVVTAVVVTVIAAFLSSSASQWWWLIAVTSVIAGLINALTFRFVAPATADSQVDHRGIGSAFDSMVAVTAPESDFEFKDQPSGIDSDTVQKSELKQLLSTADSGLLQHQKERWRYEAFRFPKSSHSVAQIEDAWRVADGPIRAAVSDGASSAYRSGEWAHVLTESWLETSAEFIDNAQQWVHNAAKRWSTNGESATSSWWMEEAESRGSFATLVGIELAPSGAWRAAAVGDSVVVHLTRDRSAWQVNSAFPVATSAQFDRHPDLVPTHPGDIQEFPEIHTTSGSYKYGDAFLLMTDALAEWSLGKAEQGTPVWNDLIEMDSETFGSLVTSERQHGHLEDDDTTLVKVLPAAKTGKRKK